MLGSVSRPATFVLANVRAGPFGFNLAQSHSSPVAPYRAASTNHGEFVAGLQLQDGLANDCCLLAGYPEWFKAAPPPMRFELRRLLATGLKQKRIHGLS